MTHRLPAVLRRTRLRLRRWIPYGVVALALLVASEVLWRWQTWHVRALLELPSGSGT